MFIKRHRYEIIVFIVNAIYMILELIASRLLSPYFGSSNMVWTSVIGIILLSSSVGNFLGGKIADKNDTENIKKSLKMLVILIAFTILLIPIFQTGLLELIAMCITNIKVGAIIATIILFFIPSMLVGCISPNIIKLRLENMQKVGETAGNISATSTLGGIVGTFLGGFYLVPNIGSNQLLYGLSAITLLLIFLIEDIKFNKKNNITYLITIAVCIGIIITMVSSIKVNAQNGEAVLNGKLDKRVEYDTEYGRVFIQNYNKGEDICRLIKIDSGNESATYIDENKKNELVFDYTKLYDLMFNSPNEINNVLMIGGAGNSYPKYYVSHFLDKYIDVVEIDKDVIELSKKYFFVQDLLNEYSDKRINLIADDGRVYLNKNTKKYDAILNDAFSGGVPAKTLTTKQALEKIYNSLNKDGMYLSNIISSFEGEDSKFLKAEINTMKQVFRNVYVIPCNDILYNQNKEELQNIMVIATDLDLIFKQAVKVNLPENEIVITDNYCPVDSIIPRIYR